MHITKDGRFMEDMGALEKELRAKGPKRVKPVGLRYDRPVAETREAASCYFACNAALGSRLLAQCSSVLVVGEESWLGDVRVSEGERVTYEELPLEGGPFDGVLADSSILLSSDLAAYLREFRRILKPGGTLCLVVANWEHEMAGEAMTYQTSFKRYGGEVYLGLVKRMLSPPEEVEYICRLDPREPSSRELALMNRNELKTLTLGDVPAARQNILSVELIEITQATEATLRHACERARFREVLVAGAPGALASAFAAGLGSLQGA
ncbi:MAG: methyltransferase domain-containing protein, partial [Candidatus Eiseniibacteriota bacterium]